ncbi:MAG: hypothetical protein FWD73_08545 [Polyangiaceae bacterium]|nr:hypothetical protein [Polyangiaceae bacterium]
MRLFQFTPKKKKHLKGLVRAGAYVGTLSLVFGVIQIRNVRAEVTNRTVELGRQMAQLASTTNHDINKISLNGQAIWVGSAAATDAAATILDRYESYCQKNSAQPTDSWRDLASKVDASVDKSFISTGVMRGGTNREGVVLCFTKSESSKPSVIDAFRAFAETGELGAFGSLRYVYVKQGDSGRALVLTAWTDDKFSIKDLVPEPGKDAGGMEFSNIPRPLANTRVLSAQIVDSPYGINVYQGQDTPSKVLAFYDDEMKNLGWFGIDPQIEKLTASEGDPNPGMARLYERDGVVLTVASKVVEGGSTMTALGLAGVGPHESFDGKDAKAMSTEMSGDMVP